MGRGNRLDLPVIGMRCAACASHVENALAGTPGVVSATVNLATSRTSVEIEPGRVRFEDLAAAVKRAGYELLPPQDVLEPEDDPEAAARRRELAEARRRFGVAAALGVPVLALAMSHGRVHVPGSEWIQLVLTLAILAYGGRGFYARALAGARRGTADMSTLVALGTGAAFAYSAVATLAPPTLRGAILGLVTSTSAAKPSRAYWSARGSRSATASCFLSARMSTSASCMRRLGFAPFRWSCAFSTSIARAYFFAAMRETTSSSFDFPKLMANRASAFPGSLKAPARAVKPESG